MNIKRLYIILIAVAFLLTVIFSCLIAFSVKKVEFKFNVLPSSDVSHIEDKISKYQGKSILFLNEKEIYSCIDEYPTFEIVSVSKKFPNVLSVEVKERIGMFSFSYDNENYVIDSEGFVIAKEDGYQSVKPLIEIDVSGCEVLDCRLGQALKFNDSGLFQSNLNIVKTLTESGTSYVDSILSITLKKGSMVEDVDYKTTTGVLISVLNANESGAEKAVAGFKSYDENADDYQKFYSVIEVDKNQTGEVISVWKSK